ncbi:TPA: oligosaccharide repeat unit polymerase [Vibrio cholerae]|nr:oligosaccharide repeat unit polymerase [Vibrio cholerae]
MQVQSYIRVRALATELSIKYLFLVTLTMIITSSIFYYLIGFYGGDLDGVEYVVELSTLIFFTMLYISGLCFSYFFSNQISNIKISKYYLMHQSKYLIASVFILFSIITVILALWGGVGTIHRDVDTNRYADLFFALFDPYTFIIIMIYYVFLNFGKSLFDRFVLFFLFFSYLFLIVRSGFTGYLILALPILISMLSNIMSRRKVVLVMMTSLLLFPFVRIGKWVIGGLSFSDINTEVFLLATRGVIERFSAVPNMIYIHYSLADNGQLLQSSYLPFFQGYIGSFLHKLLFSSPVESITLFLHQVIQSTNSDSNSTFPLLSYFSLDLYIGGLALIYALFWFFILSCLLSVIFGKSLFGRKIISFFIFYILFFYVFNGWFWAFWGCMQAIILFIMLLLLFGKISSITPIIR